jgi:predicted dehydrogenase
MSNETRKQEGAGGLSGVSRRAFVKRSLAAAGAVGVAPYLSPLSAHGVVRGANDSIGVGYIGAGIRGDILLRQALALGGTRALEVCDVYDGHLAQARHVAGSSLRVGRDYRRLLDNPEVEAVVISVPDHWHMRMTLDAMEAGKDVYLEKPMTYRWEEVRVISDAARAHARIVQGGSQYESMPANERAAEMIQSGALGKVTLVSGNIHRNTATGAWYYPIPPDASPATIDWPRFLGPAPPREFDVERFFRWRLYWDYSGGLPTDLFVHLITATHVLMGVTMAKRVMAMGGIYNWTDREVPDQVSALVEYPEGFMLTLTATANNNHDLPLLRIMGTEGTLDYYGTRLVHHREPVLENYTYATTSWPEATRQKYAERHDLDPESMRPRETAHLRRPEPEQIDTPGVESTRAHLAKFFDSVRTRTQPYQNADMGGLSATVGHMINLSLQKRNDVRWDPVKREVLI